MKERILKFLTHENISSTRFADEIGVQRSSVSHILSGRNNPSFEFIQKILLRYKLLNSEWLMLGTGSMYKKTEQMDLFSAPQVMEPNKNSAPSPPIISDNTSSQEDDILNTIPLTQKIEPSRKVDKILVFYSDKTFDEFMPGK